MSHDPLGTPSQETRRLLKGESSRARKILKWTVAIFLAVLILLVSAYGGAIYGFSAGTEYGAMFGFNVGAQYGHQACAVQKKNDQFERGKI